LDTLDTQDLDYFPFGWPEKFFTRGIDASEDRVMSDRPKDFSARKSEREWPAFYIEMRNFSNEISVCGVQCVGLLQPYWPALDITLLNY
jgi:hypothetical protein